METDDHLSIELKFTFPDSMNSGDFRAIFDPQEFRMEFNITSLANLSAKLNLGVEPKAKEKPLPISPIDDKGSQLAIQKQLEISRLEEIFLNADSPAAGKRVGSQTVSSIFSATISQFEKSPGITGMNYLATTYPARIQMQTALTGFFDLHEATNDDCNMNQAHFTFFDDDFVAGQLECSLYVGEAEARQHPVVVRAPKRKRTAEEVDELLKSVFEESDDDDDEVVPCQVVTPVVTSSLRDSAKFLSKPNCDLQSVVNGITRPNYERTAAKQRENVVAMEQPFKNPFKVQKLHEASGQGSRNHQEVNQERFPINTESRIFNDVYAASTSAAGRVSLDVQPTLTNTSNDVELRGCQLENLRGVFDGNKCPDALMRDFQLKN